MWLSQKGTWKHGKCVTIFAVFENAALFLSSVNFNGGIILYEFSNV